ncbi:ABC transporter substrate-binding protein [Chitiniphilus purpureus]|uniref:ABC transporter substrate-binding protein n=1 Tax=Chitiniphilus purpureus TaxID=2981137 RepID=A0ABY6DPJ7_9NEIS|nr:ABC transporter substrate-binding protein [Chitiniphilus sp. CD1]UXY16276.1 ABC transporter substrate-binding protein [Chitiniphilus sp. CD1]
MLRKVLLPCLIFGALAASAFAAPEDEEIEAVIKAPEAQIVIGQSVPTTGPGADTGKALALGASLYFGRVNARGGINGAVIDHKVIDDGGDPRRAVQNTRQLLDKDNALLLVGYYGSATVSELSRSRVLVDGNAALIGAHAGSDLIRLPADPHVFQTRAGYTQELEKTVQLLAGNLGMTRIGALAQDDADGQAALKSLRSALAKHRAKLEVEVTFNPRNGDVGKAAQTLAKSNPQAVLLLTTSKPAAEFVKKYKALGGTSQLYGISLIQFEDVLRYIGKKDAHGLGISQVYPYPFNVQLRFIREFQEDTGAVLRSGEFPSYAVLEGYISARLAIEALKRAGKNPTRAAVTTALSTLGRLDLGGYAVDFSDRKRLGANFVELTMISPTGTLTR